MAAIPCRPGSSTIADSGHAALPTWELYGGHVLPTWELYRGIGGHVVPTWDLYGTENEKDAITIKI